MRVTAVEPIIVEVPTREPVKGVHGVTRTQRSVLVRLATDRDIVGWGNLDPSPGFGVGIDPRALARLREA
jgi:L-alanine-DL-glutamate epimerase-like enolase superfamily enzyme